MSSLSTKRAIYLDYQATTPCDRRVIDAMLPFFGEEFGNPASRTHGFGWRAEEALERAREQVARLIGADPREIVFTSGATESNNLAIRGAVMGHRRSGGKGDHLVTCQTEHHAVLDPCRALEKEGFRVTALRVRGDGLIDLDALRAALEPGTILISIMHANNEIGVIQDLEPIGRVAHERGILLHSDAAQSVGKIPVDVASLGVDLLSLTAHKLYGPKGIGALYVRRRPRVGLEPILYGGGHEQGLRSGTVPVPLCVGLGAACEIAGKEMPGESPRLRRLRDRFWELLSKELEEISLNGHPEQRLAGNLNVSFAGVESEALILALPELAVSTGSACTSARPEPSHVLRALGLPPRQTLGSLRFGLGRPTTEAEIDRAAGRIVEEVRRLRALSPVWEDGRGRR